MDAGCRGCGSEPSRREVLIRAFQAALGVTVVGVATPILEACGIGPTGVGRSAATTFDVSQLTTDGQALVTRDNGPDGAPVLIVRQSAGQFLALSMQCTHQGCTIGAPSGGIMTCPCHGAQFDLQGAVVRGPAAFPLHRYGVTYDAAAQTLTIS